MRREGAGIDAIAARLGVTPRVARGMIEREVRAAAGEAEPGERRILHVEALMDVWRALQPRAAAGDIEAVDRFLRVEERLSALLGLEAGAERPAAPPDARIAPPGSSGGPRPLRRPGEGGARAGEAGPVDAPG